MRHRTLRAKVLFEGVGIHLGLPARVEVHPARYGSGIVFQSPQGASLQARIDRATGEPGSTTLKGSGFQVRTVEHLLAALFGMGVSDARILIDGLEIPAMDGSAEPFVRAIQDVGLDEGPPIADPIVIERELVVRDVRGAEARFTPSGEREVAVDVDFGDPPMPRGQCSVELSGDQFEVEVAFARTFIVERDLEVARVQGRGRGATPENTVVFTSRGPSVSLRSPDEAVRHKLLDAVGDLALAGRPIIGRFEVRRGSHALHRRAVAALLQQYRFR